MAIPNGWTEVTNGAWGMGLQRYPENVPTGAHYVDAFGNRCVATPDGHYKVEGIGTGVNAGKPDGEWWDWTPELAAGPTTAEPWVEADGEAADNTHTIETPAVPLTIANPASGSDQPPPLSAPSNNPEVVGKPALHLTEQPGGTWLLRMEHRVGHVFEEAGTDLRALLEKAKAWVEAHV